MAITCHICAIRPTAANWAVWSLALCTRPVPLTDPCDPPNLALTSPAAPTEGDKNAWRAYWVFIVPVILLAAISILFETDYASGASPSLST